MKARICFLSGIDAIVNLPVMEDADGMVHFPDRLMSPVPGTKMNIYVWSDPKNAHRLADKKTLIYKEVEGKNEGIPEFTGGGPFRRRASREPNRH